MQLSSQSRCSSDIGQRSSTTHNFCHCRRPPSPIQSIPVAMSQLGWPVLLLPSPRHAHVDPVRQMTLWHVILPHLLPCSITRRPPLSACSRAPVHQVTNKHQGVMQDRAPDKLSDAAAAAKTPYNSYPMLEMLAGQLKSPWPATHMQEHHPHGCRNSNNKL